MWEIASNFAAFLENLNFNKSYWFLKIDNILHVNVTRISVGLDDHVIHDLGLH